MNQIDKRENVKNMLSDMGKILRNMPEGELKTQFKQFLFMVASGNVPLTLVFSSLAKKIQAAKEARNATVEMPSIDVVKFWERIRDLMYNTYEMNKKD